MYAVGYEELQYQMKALAQKILRAFQYFDIGIIRYSTLEKLRSNSQAAHDYIPTKRTRWRQCTAITKIL